MMNNIIFHADDYGRSPNISKTIYECIKKKKIKSISIIVTEKIYGLKYLKKTKVQKRLHLNLTDFSEKQSKKNYIYNLSFLSLILMPILPNFEIKKKKIEKEIIRQIELYKKYLKTDKIFLDGHQHVHMIPWIFKLIYNLRRKKKITNIRIPDERFIVNKFDLLRFDIIKNIFKYFILKLFIIVSGKKINNVNYNYNFFGIIYSGFQSKNSINQIIRFSKKINTKKKLEILVHPGFSNYKERKLFKKNIFKYYISNNRKKEFELTKSLKVK